LSKCFFEGESFISVIAEATCFSLRITDFIRSGTGHVVACGDHFCPSTSVLVGTIMSIGAPLSGSAAHQNKIFDIQFK
jgi:hypothetical protein